MPIDEYLRQCNMLRVEPSRRSLELLQVGQQIALQELKDMEAKE